MTNDERRAWLDALKPGDEVVVCEPGSVRTATVLRRTPSGRIIIKQWSGEFVEFNPDGRERGGNRRWPLRVEPMTDRWRAEFEYRALVAKLGAIQWRALPLEKLRKVAAALEATL